MEKCLHLGIPFQILESHLQSGSSCLKKTLLKGLGSYLGLGTIYFGGIVWVGTVPNQNIQVSIALRQLSNHDQLANSVNKFAKLKIL